MDQDLSLFSYTTVHNDADKTLILLHGTGGDMDDFLFLDRQLGKTFNLVGLRGNVLEHGMRRFFRRMAHGVFDEANMRDEADKLRRFVTAWMTTHRVHAHQLHFLGYSNGANMLLATLFWYPELFHRVVCLHPMVPHRQIDPTKEYGHIQLLVSHGEDDEMVSSAQQQELHEFLVKLSIPFSERHYPSGHAISDVEIDDVVGWLMSFL